MKRNLLLLMGMWVCDVNAIRWPSLSDPVIMSCDNKTCTSRVWYSHSGTVFQEQPELIKPPSVTSRYIHTYGIHCESGSKLPGYESPFSGCYWASESAIHAPYVRTECIRISNESWELTNSSTCSTDSWYGPHSGAGPGGECVLFGILEGNILYTPMGALDAATVAHSGNRFCVKPLPPATKCDLQLNDTILDHGVLTPNASSTASVTGVIDCGEKPVVEFVGGADFTIAPGVNGSLNADVDTTTNKITINSRVTTVNAKGGEYSASKVITVTPW
ncbi:hypothetical protein ACLEYI_20155 [Enterobacter ludwigii]|uniref:hypothetical protein n=1 Tax=Enterobacter ludwigii TaxID=299767 RepID=UPI0039747127